MQVSCPIQIQRMGKDLSGSHQEKYEVRSRKNWTIHSFDDEHKARAFLVQRNISSLKLVRVTVIEEEI